MGQRVLRRTWQGVWEGVGGGGRRWAQKGGAQTNAAPSPASSVRCSLASWEQHSFTEPSPLHHALMFAAHGHFACTAHGSSSHLSSLGHFAHERTSDQRGHQGIHSHTDAKHESGEWNPSLVHPGGSVILFLGETDTFNSFFHSTRLHPLVECNQFTQPSSEKLELVVSASEVAGLALQPILLPVTLWAWPKETILETATGVKSKYGGQTCIHYII